MSDHSAEHAGGDADGWNDSTASSVDPAQRGQIKLFCSVTGADADSALHVLEAHNWDMDRSVMFFMEGGAPAPAPPQSRLASTAAVHAPAQQIAAEEPIDLDDDPPSAPVEPQRPSEAVGTAPPNQHELWEMDEDEQNLQKALQASMQPEASEGAVGTSHPDVMDEDDNENGDAAFGRMLASHNQNMQNPSRPFDNADDSFAGFNRGFLDGGGQGGMPQPRRRGVPTTIPSVDNDAALQAIGRRMGLPMPSDMAASSGAANPLAPFMAPPTAAGRSGAAHQSAAMPDMPSDINVEEARMLEAAMLGIPYEGRMPDFTAQPARPDQHPTSPGAVAGRAVRQEQDYAYQQSLQADRDKREALERAEQEKTEALETAARQLAEQQASESAKEANLKSTLQQKQQALPAEPDAGEADVVQMAVRMPTGTRFTRRFRCTDQLGSLFDAIDVHTQGETLRPGTYRVVAQFPRRVFTEGTPGSLRDVGLAQAKQETVLIESID